MKRNGYDTAAYGQMRASERREEIQLIACVNGNTVRKADPSQVRNTIYTPSRKTAGTVRRNGSAAGHRCEVYDFAQHTGIAAGKDRPRRKSSDARKRKRRQNMRRAMQRRERAARYALLGVAAALMITIFTGIGSRASSREFPKAYKYYDTITVGYQENLLDIVQRYDNREFYETQKDYVKELCRINNLVFDDTGYPEVSPGTHLVVPYYSEELK